MELTTHSGLVIDDATTEDIRIHLPGEVYAILSASEAQFVQCHERFPSPPFGSGEFKRFPPPRRIRIGKFPRTTRGSGDWLEQAYILEYQDGSLDEHYAAVHHVASNGGPITLAQVSECLCKYLQGDPSWRTDFTWEKMDL
jgi:hypothetical protein